MQSTASEGSAQLAAVTDLILGYLESKSLFEAQRALRVELALLQEATIAKGDLVPATNLHLSELERRLGMDDQLPREHLAQSSTPIAECTPSSCMPKLSENMDPMSEGKKWPDDNRAPAQPAPQGGMPSYTFHRHESVHDEKRLRDRVGCISMGSGGVVFHDPPVMPREDAACLANLSLSVVYNPNVNGLEDASELTLDVGTVVIDRYKVVTVLGKGSFSCVYQCLDMLSNGMVAIKVWMHAVEMGWGGGARQPATERSRAARAGHSQRQGLPRCRDRRG